MRKGFGEILVVFLVSVVGLLIVIDWQSRLFLSIHRMRSLTDILKATYGAESVINDYVARFIGPYAGTTSGTTTLEDGTVVTVNTSTSGNTETFGVLAKRPFATTLINLLKTTTSSGSGAYDAMDVMLVTDCTSSMNQPASPTATCQSCCNLLQPNINCDPDYASAASLGNYNTCMITNGCDTRFSALEKATDTFLTSMKDLAIANPTKTIRAGWIVFRQNAKQLQALNTDISSVKTYFDANMGMTQSTSPACSTSNVTGYTSIGAGYDLANATMGLNSSATKKRYVVTISDGEPNVRVASDTGLCGLNTCTTYGTCDTESLNLLSCSVTDINALLWPNSAAGSKWADVTPYSIIIGPDSGAAVDLLKIKTKYINSPDASHLDAILQGIFNDIVTSSTSISIKRVTPTP